MTQSNRHRQHARHAWKRIDQGAGVVAMLAFWVAGALWMYWGITQPTEPTIGRTWGINYRGRVAYLLDSQFTILMGLLVLSGVAVIVLVLIEVLLDPFNRRRR